MPVMRCQWLQGLHCLIRKLCKLAWCAKLIKVNSFSVKVLNVAKQYAFQASTYTEARFTHSLAGFHDEMCSNDLALNLQHCLLLLISSKADLYAYESW